MIEALRHAAAFPHPVDRIEILETHISWVILTGSYAYKIKKPVNLGFLDFTTLEQRRHYCEEELRLNRRWAPQLYVDVVPIVNRAGEIRVAGEGTPIEYAVRMRQFDQDRRLDHLIERDRLTTTDVLELAEEIAARHGQARKVPFDEHLTAATERLMWDNLDVLAGNVPATVLDRVTAWTRDQLEAHRTLIRARCEQGYFRDCHGDLHLGNIVRLREGIRAFDCIEFSRELREIDVVADYAFLAMDFIARGAAGFAYQFVNRYLEQTGDYDGARLLPMYIVYRSMVRAKVAVLGHASGGARTDNAEDRHTLERYCALARAMARPRRPLLILMTGLSGSGKTWLSTRLIPTLPALRLRSDLERKRLFELDEYAASGAGTATGIYAEDANIAVYDRLLNLAAGMLRCGVNVILDATFLDAANRQRARDMAEACAADCVMIQTVASDSRLRDRLQARSRRADASEADSGILDYQLGTADALAAEELQSTLVVDTESDIDIDALAATLRQLAEGREPVTY